MLNTDLHIADLAKHMSRADFVRNSMRAIQESMPANDHGASTPDLVRDDSGSVRLGSNPSIHQTGTSRARPTTSMSVSQRSASAPVVNQSQPLPRPDSDRSVSVAGGVMMDGKSRSSSTTVSSFSYGKQWESEAENALKVGRHS
jgi:PH/SEC7 domain-containing protein